MLTNGTPFQDGELFKGVASKKNGWDAVGQGFIMNR